VGKRKKKERSIPSVPGLEKRTVEKKKSWEDFPRGARIKKNALHTGPDFKMRPKVREGREKSRKEGSGSKEPKIRAKNTNNGSRKKGSE